MRTGKIARLPLETRTQLNHRLQSNTPAAKLLLWLNALPEVRAVLKEHFHSRPINFPNLSHWTQGGYRDWLHQQECHELAHTFTEHTTAFTQDHPPLTDTLNHCLTARLTLTLRRIGDLNDTDPDASHKLLRKTIRDLAILQRNSTQSRREQRQRDHLTFREDQARQKTDLTRQQTEAAHEAWALHPDNHDHLDTLWRKTYPNDFHDDSDDDTEDDFEDASEPDTDTPPPTSHQSHASHESHPSTSPSHPLTPSSGHPTPARTLRDDRTPEQKAAYPAVFIDDPNYTPPNYKLSSKSLSHPTDSKNNTEHHPNPGDPAHPKAPHPAPPGKVFCHTVDDYIDLPTDDDDPDTNPNPDDDPATCSPPSAIPTEYSSTPTVTSEAEFQALMSRRRRESIV